MGDFESYGAFFNMGAFNMGLGFVCILSLGRMVRWLRVSMVMGSGGE